MKFKLTALFISLSCIFCLVGCSDSVETSQEERPSEYQTASWSTILQDVVDNPARATQKYVGQYYSFYGEIFFISDDATYISINEINPGYYTSSVSCIVLDEEDVNTIINANKGDAVTIKGKITDIEHDVLGNTAELDMDLYEIIIE